MTAPRGTLPCLALAVAILAGVAYCEGRTAAQDETNANAARATADSAQARADSATQRETALRAERDALRLASVRDSLRLDSLSRRITIVRPGVIHVASIEGADLPHSDPPSVTVTVPREVTDFMQAQAARIVTLTAELAVADSGWAAADSVGAAQARALAAKDLQIAALEHKTRHFWDRFGISAGYGLTATPTGQVVHGVQLGASVKLWP